MTGRWMTDGKGTQVLPHCFTDHYVPLFHSPTQVLESVKDGEEEEEQGASYEGHG